MLISGPSTRVRLALQFCPPGLRSFVRGIEKFIDAGTSLSLRLRCPVATSTLPPLLDVVPSCKSSLLQIREVGEKKTETA